MISILLLITLQKSAAYIAWKVTNVTYLKYYYGKPCLVENSQMTLVTFLKPSGTICIRFILSRQALLRHVQVNARQIQQYMPHRNGDGRS
ncbi:MAG TPA: hypothetical protein VGN64_08165 [Dyadobacter sp.]|jgi:hypothetical protein|nr:hypothetical protein [Dyadobacter sp.]